MTRPHSDIAPLPARHTPVEEPPWPPPPGKKSARERIDLLMDPGSFVEVGALVRHRSTAGGKFDRRPAGDAVLTGHGEVNGRPVCAYAQDFSVFGGTLGEVVGEKIVKIMDLAAEVGCPIVGINDSAGGRIQEGVVAQRWYGEIFYRNVRLSGVVPQISLIMGPCAGGAVYSPALTDFTIMVDRSSYMFVTGPVVLKTATGEDIGLEELGGARVHNTRSGNAHHLAPDEASALRYTRQLLSYLAADGTAGSRCVRTVRAPNAPTCVPAEEPYDMHTVLSSVLDDGEFLEVHSLFAPNILVGLGRVDGRRVGVVANQPNRMAGWLDVDACEKAARFVRTCDAFNLPVLSLVDVPGFLPDVGQEWTGAARRGAKLLFAYAEATVPLITVIIGKAYGAGYEAMGSKHLGADVNLAWPTARIAVAHPVRAVEVIHRQALDAAGEDAEALRERLREAYESTVCVPQVAAERGYIDAVITAASTRDQISRQLRFLGRKQGDLPMRKHDNIPL